MRILLIVVLLLTVGLFSCDKDSKADIYCHSNYVVNAAGNQCICPPSSFVEIEFESGESSCVLNTNDLYLCTLSGDLCFNDGDFTAYNGSGYAQFNLSSLNLTFGTSSTENIGLAFNAQFTDVNTMELDDGRLEVSMIYQHPTWSDDCFDWSTRAEVCPKVIKGYINGISNNDKSAIDLNVKWKDCDGTILNTGIIHLKKP